MPSSGGTSPELQKEISARSHSESEPAADLEKRTPLQNQRAPTRAVVLTLGTIPHDARNKNYERGAVIDSIIVGVMVAKPTTQDCSSKDLDLQMADTLAVSARSTVYLGTIVLHWYPDRSCCTSSTGLG